MVPIFDVAGLTREYYGLLGYEAVFLYFGTNLLHASLHTTRKLRKYITAGTLISRCRAFEDGAKLTEIITTAYTFKKYKIFQILIRFLLLYVRNFE
jgi:hypothetical protein